MNMKFYNTISITITLKKGTYKYKKIYIQGAFMEMMTQ